MQTIASVARSRVRQANAPASAQPSDPAIGVHKGTWHGQSGNDGGLTPSSPLQVLGLTTQASGSSIAAFLLAEVSKASAPSDNKGNSYGSPVHTSLGYGGDYPGYGLESYVKLSAAGGASHNFEFTKNAAGDEGTLIIAEVKNAATLQDQSVVFRPKPGAGVPYQSGTVTTTGPAILLTLWGGGGGTDIASQQADVESGWTLIESLFRANISYIQAALAWKAVGAGVHSVAWTPVANQSAIISLLAFQA